MEKLELKHLAPYLPYGLKRHCASSNVMIHDYTAMEFTQETCDRHQSYGWKPILRPLSDLFKLIDWDNNNDPYMIGCKYGIEKVNEDGIEFYASEYYADYAETPKCYVDITSFDWWLFEKHFDVFGLIEKGLAIDINTLNERV